MGKTDFSAEGSELWAIQAKWRREIMSFGGECEKKGKLAISAHGRDAAAWHKQTTKCAVMAFDLFTEVASIEQRERLLEAGLRNLMRKLEGTLPFGYMLEPEVTAAYELLGESGDEEEQDGDNP